LHRGIPTVVFSIGGELYWLHETLKSGYTTAGIRRIIMSHSDYRDWTVELQEEDLLILQCKKEYTYHAFSVEADWMAVAIGQPNGRSST
jgi:hypothetical protein